MEAPQNALRYARAYAEQGFAVLPVHTLNPFTKRCTCGKAACERVAKHPHAAFAPHGLKDASKDHVRLGDWFARHRLNVGIATGSTSGIIAIDADPKTGGVEEARKLARRFPVLAETLRAKTGSGGYHFLLRYEGTDIRPSVSALAPGIDVRAEGSYIVAPPSVHACGAGYTWDNRATILPVPYDLGALLKELSAKSSTACLGAGGALIPRGTINATLTAIGGHLRSLGCTEAEILTLYRALAERCEDRPTDRQLEQWARSAAQWSQRTPIPDLVARIVKNLARTDNLV
jgi:hypothetical protein